jgi:hypothetical protein
VFCGSHEPDGKRFENIVALTLEGLPITETKLPTRSKRDEKTAINTAATY